MAKSMETVDMIPMYEIIESNKHGLRIACPGVAALSNRIRRWNLKNPDRRIRKIHGYINLPDLRRVIADGWR